MKALSRIDYPIQTAAKLISQIDDSSRSVVTQKIKELLFVTKDDRLNRYVAVTLAKDQEVQGRLLQEAQDSSSPHQAAAVWILGQGPFNNPATITVLRANLQSVNPSVRLNSIKSLENLLTTDTSVMAMLEEMIKNDKNRQVRLAAKEAWQQLDSYADHLEQDDGLPDDGFDIDDKPDMNKDLADDEMHFYNNYVCSVVEDDDEEYLPKQSSVDRWITDGYFSREYWVDDKEKKDGQKVLIERERNKHQNNMPIQVYDKSGKKITVTVSEQTLKQYKLLQMQGKNLSVEEVLALDDFSLKYLIEQNLYLTNTKLESIVGAYINSDKDLLAKLIIKNVYETGIVVTIVKEGFRIYKGQNKDFNLLHAKELTIRNFIKTFNTFAEEYGSEKLTDPFEYTEHKCTSSPTTASPRQQLKVVYPETAPIVPPNSTSLLLTPTSSHNLSSNALAQLTNCLTSKQEEKLTILTAQSSTYQTPSSQPIAPPVLTTEQLADLKTLGINITDETVIQLIYTNPMQLKDIYANCYLTAEVKSIDALRAAYGRLRQSHRFKALTDAKTLEAPINADLEIFGLTVVTAKPVTLIEAYERLWIQALLQGGQPNIVATEAYKRLRQFEKFRFLPIHQIVGEQAQQSIIKRNEKLIEEAQQAAQQLAQAAAEKYGLTLHNVLNKGNCFFDSVRDQLQQHYEIGISADHLRIIAMQQMYRNPDRYAGSLSAGQDFSFGHVEQDALKRIKGSINLDHAKDTLSAAALGYSITITEDVSIWSMDRIFKYCHENQNAVTTVVLANVVFPLLTSAEKVAAHANAMLENVGTAAEYRKWADDIDVLAMSDALRISIISVQPTGQVPPAPTVSSSSSTGLSSSSLSSSNSSSLSSNAAATSVQTTLHYYNQGNASVSPPIVIAFTGMNHYQSLRGDTIQVSAAAAIQLPRQGLALPPLNPAQLREFTTKSLQEAATTFDSLSASRRSDKDPSDSSPLASSSPHDHKSGLQKDKKGGTTSLNLESAGASRKEKISSIRALLVGRSPKNSTPVAVSSFRPAHSSQIPLSSSSASSSSLLSSSSKHRQREGLFAIDKYNEIWKKALSQLPNRLGLGIAYSENDCFFDAIAQALPPDKLKEFKSNNPFEKLKWLRVLCSKKANELNKYAPNNNWIKKWDIWNRIDISYERYLSHIQYARHEADGSGLKDTDILQGEPEVDGRLLCIHFDIRLHIMGVDENTDAITHKIISNDPFNPVDHIKAEKVDYNDANLIHIAHSRNHFVPLLHGGSRQIGFKSAQSKEKTEQEPDDYVYDHSLKEGWGEPDVSLSSLSGNISSLSSSSSSNAPSSPPKMAPVLAKSIGTVFSSSSSTGDSSFLTTVPAPDDKKTSSRPKKKKKAKKPSLNGPILG